MRCWLGLLLLVALMEDAHAMACRYADSRQKVTLNLKVGLEELPHFHDRIDRGMGVTLLNNVEITNKNSEALKYYFGCKVRYVLWEEIYMIEPLNGERSRTLSKLKDLPHECVRFTVPIKSGISTIRLTSILNPVSDKQLQITRQWLAEKGIGAGSSRIFGRAVNALMDLESDHTSDMDCERSKTH